MRAPIVARKHYVQKTLTTVTAGTSNVERIVFAVVPNAVDQEFEVAEGAVVKALYVEMWIRGQDTSPGSVLVTIVKTKDGQTPTFTDMTALHDYTNKANVFYHTQGLTNINTNSAIPFVRQWVKIPKGKQRMAFGDSWWVVVSAQALDSNVCGFVTYKDYT